MDTTGKIIRRSIHTFLRNYHYFANTTAFLLLPVSLAILLSQAVVSFSSLPLLLTIYARLRTLFEAAGFPPYSNLVSDLLSLKFSQTICSSIFTLPFTLSFLLIAKASIIRALHSSNPCLPPSFSSVCHVYGPILITHLCNLFVILSANAASFFLFFLAFNSLDAFGLLSSPYFFLLLSGAGAVLYSVILAKSYIICNLALVVSGMENCRAYIAILKACVLIRGRSSTALSLALILNLGLASVEALFQYRVVRAYHLSHSISFLMAFEGLLIAYLYSVLIVLDSIISCLFFKSCKSCCWIDQGDGYHHNIIQLIGEEEDYVACTNSRALPEFP